MTGLAINKSLSLWETEILYGALERNYLRIAIFSSDKSLLYANVSMQKLLHGEPHKMLLNPDFEKLRGLPENESHLVFTGYLTIGESNKINHSFPALVFKKSNQLLILGSEDTENLQNQNLILHQLNNQINDLQRQLISEKRSLEKTLDILDDRNKTLERINLQKDKLFSVIAHDLKSPFSGILGITEVLKENIHDLTIQQIKVYTELLFKTTNSTYHMLENLLEWASVQRQKVRLKPEPIHLKTLIGEVLAITEGEASNKNLSIKVELESKLEWTADKNMLLSIIRNLLTNAIKFSHRNTEVVVSVFEKNSELEVSIADKGIGMPPDVLKNLFLNEFNESERGTENEKGSGLGLVICREFVEMHSGRIRAESKHGEGTTITFTLPKHANIPVD